MKKIRIAYIGGGSRLWARNLMSDLALATEIEGVVSLYDINESAARNNAVIGNKMMELPESNHAFRFEVAHTLEESLSGADFVFISILPGTFEEMRAYVHIPEKHGVYQPVGDTAGPAGIFRSLIMMPMFFEIALAIEYNCPNAWVINFTNPMTMCVEMLYHVYPNIKAFGNCHEVFGTQKILARALKEETGIEASHKDIDVNVQGINHFTWINYASYKDIDLLPAYYKFVEKYKDTGWITDEELKKGYPFSGSDMVKFDLFQKYGVIAAAGDRHLVEFLPKEWYLSDLLTIEKWKFFLTPVDFRIRNMEKGDKSARNVVNGTEEVQIQASGEEGIKQVKALLGLHQFVTNVNMPNMGQIPNLPIDRVVETNALFRRDSVQPVYSGEMKDELAYLTERHMWTHELLLKAFDERDLKYAYEALKNDPAVESLTVKELRKMFEEIIERIEPYLSHYMI